jgi:hypothetical protein
MTAGSRQWPPILLKNTIEEEDGRSKRRYQGVGDQGYETYQQQHDE